MGQYRKKPVVIEAFKWTGHEDQAEDPVWIVEAIKDGRVRFKNACTSYVSLLISTLEGTMEAKQGDWIIRGLKGELYPCKSDIFEASYELVEDEECGEVVYCHGCSVSGCADMPVYHAPPACRYEVVTCVYCGHEYPAGTQTSGAQILTDHIRRCEKHPMKKVSDEHRMLRKALVGLVGVDTREELEAMEAYIRSAPAPDEDKMTSINGIHALIKTLPGE